VGLFYIIYKKNVSRGFIRGICKGNVYITQSTSENHIRSRPKVCNSILGSLYGKAKNLNGDFNGISPINGQINKKTKLNIRTVFITLY